MESFTCFECKQILEYFKFSKTQQKISRRTKNGKCIKCVESKDTIKENDSILNNYELKSHPLITGLYFFDQKPKNVIDTILDALKNVPWNKSICRSTYSCGWEWLNYNGGSLSNWRSPPKNLANAISLLKIPPIDIRRGSFNQIIFTKYHKHTYTCDICNKNLSAFQFQKDNVNPNEYICNYCRYNKSKEKENELEGMIAHIDRKELGPVVWGITLKGNGFIRFSKYRNDTNYIDISANEGTGYYMTNESRYKWYHQPYGHERISMTIRAVPCKSPKVKDLGFSE